MIRALLCRVRGHAYLTRTRPAPNDVGCWCQEQACTRCTRTRLVLL